MALVDPVVDGGPHTSRGRAHRCPKELEQVHVSPPKDIVAHDNAHRIEDGADGKVEPDWELKAAKPLFDDFKRVVRNNVGIHRLGIGGEKAGIGRKVTKLV